MARIASVVAWLCTALWLGGMIFLFIAVQALFRWFPRTTSDVAVEAVPRLFSSFETYQFILAAVALLATFLWYLACRSRLVMILFVLLALAGVTGALSSVLLTAKMQKLRADGQSHSTQFRRLHGESMLAYSAQAGLLLAGCSILPAAVAGHRTKPEAAAG